MQYLNARYYDPELGLFLQPDWFEVTMAGVGTNRYSYSFNDPVNLRDPGGNAIETPWDVLNVVLGGGSKGAIVKLERVLNNAEQVGLTKRQIKHVKKMKKAAERHRDRLENLMDAADKAKDMMDKL